MQLRQICNQQTQNKRSSDRGQVGPMLNETRRLLNTFYEPFNNDLADILKNDGFLWRWRFANSVLRYVRGQQTLQLYNAVGNVSKTIKLLE